jgi:hypothetical protein
MKRNFFFITMLGIGSHSIADGASRQAARDDTLDLLNSPERLNKLTDPKAQAALQNVKTLLPDAGAQQKLLSLSGDIFGRLIDRGFDEAKIAAILQEAQRNPASLAAYLSEEDLQAIKQLSGSVGATPLKKP